MRSWLNWTTKDRQPPGQPRGEDQMRICHLGKFYPPAPGGMETHVRALARAQAELGAEISVVCVNHLDCLGNDVSWHPLGTSRTIEEQDGTVRVIRLGRWASLARLEVCPRLLGMVSRLGRASIDILHLHVPNPAMLLALAVFRPSIPLVITCHSDTVRQKLLARAIRPIEEFVFRQARQILATSPLYPAGSSLLQRYPDKVAILPMGLDLEPYLRPSAAVLAQARRLRDEHGTPLWLAVGRLVYYKGLPIALAALAKIPGKLIVIGEGPLNSQLKRLARDLHVAERVIWLGSAATADVIAAYHAATALWFPSVARSEGFGLVQVEAMASGCPVINTAIPASGVSWVSLHGDTGFTVPVNDPLALAAAAQRLITEAGLRDRLAHAARERVRMEFDHRLMAKRSLRIYRQVLGGETTPFLDPLRRSA